MGDAVTCLLHTGVFGGVWGVGQGFSRLITVALTGAVLFASVDAVAQSADRRSLNVGQILRTIQPDRLSNIDADAVTDEEAFLLRQRPRYAPGLAEPELPQTKVEVRGFRFSGNTQIEDVEFDQLLTAFVDRQNSISDLGAAAATIAELYHARGFFVARAVVPPQQVVDGIVHMLVFEGRLETDGLIVANETARTRTAYVRDILTREIREADLIRLADYERALLLANDLPGVSVHARLFPGIQVGTARISVELVETPPFAASISADNFGFHGFGANRATATTTLDNLAGENDRLTAGASTSGQGQKYVFGEILLPVGNNGLTAKLLGSWFDYTLVDDYAVFGGSGDGLQIAAEVSFPLVRRTTESTYVTGKLERNIHTDEETGVATSERTIDAAELAVHGDFGSVTFAPAITTYAARFHAGNVDHSAGADSFETGGGFVAVELKGEHLQNISGPVSWFTRATALAGSQNLEGTFQCTVGGPFSNRGYPVGEGSADRCLSVSTDLRYDAPQFAAGADWQFSVFYDHIVGDQFHTTPAGQTNFNYDLNSVGVGVNANWLERGFVHAALGYQLATSPGEKLTGHAADYSSNDLRFWFQGVLFF